MVPNGPGVAQVGGLPDIVPDLIGAASAMVLLLIVVALAAFVYRSLTGGVEWPEDVESDSPAEPTDDELREGGTDEEWDYY